MMLRCLLHQFRNRDEARTATAHWLTMYNEQRSHSAIGKRPPLGFEQGWQHQHSLLSAATA